MAIELINVEPGETPKCPRCEGTKWAVRQRIERESNLKRVDKFADLVVENPDPQANVQSLLMECLDCGLFAQPQPGIWGKTEFYAEGVQKLSGIGEDAVVVEEKVSGYEDGANWPRQVQNEAEWVEGDLA